MLARALTILVNFKWHAYYITRSQPDSDVSPGSRAWVYPVIGTIWVGLAALSIKLASLPSFNGSPSATTKGSGSKSYGDHV